MSNKKIADCLSSLDELIAVETQKLDALRGYKKGLMQGKFCFSKFNFPLQGNTEYQQSRRAGESECNTDGWYLFVLS
jgi:type I restriction enzyme S subunit